MRIGATGIVINEYNEVLLIKRDDTRTWAPPGGALDVGELPAQGVEREVLEETGLYVKAVRLVGVQFVPIKPQGSLIFVFRCIQRGGEAKPTAEALVVTFARCPHAANPLYAATQEPHQNGPPAPRGATRPRNA